MRWPGEAAALSGQRMLKGQQAINKTNPDHSKGIDDGHNTKVRDRKAYKRGLRSIDAINRRNDKRKEIKKRDRKCKRLIKNKKPTQGFGGEEPKPREVLYSSEELQPLGDETQNLTSEKIMRPIMRRISRTKLSTRTFKKLIITRIILTLSRLT